jgi:uroporphyrinogen decarboxylase
MEGLRRAVKLVRLDLIGFGEDIGCKNGPLVSPAMFRRFIFPRYKKVMDFARSHGVELAWCDTDGDVRDKVLANAPAKEGSFFGVPKVIE